MTLLIRRQNPPQLTSYQGYKKYLRQDFHYSCVYCRIHENELGGPRAFHVEHFRPKSKYPGLRNDYSNLMYSCSICNSFKGDDWPSDDPIADGRGYLDPALYDYDAHFKLTSQDGIRGLTPAATYMVEMLHLYRPQLLKVFQNRETQEATHRLICSLFRLALSLVEKLVATSKADQALRDQLQGELQELVQAFGSYEALWSARLEPDFDPADYK